jgi:CubicO group peptidase (beta-lactamase class C family)
MMRTFVVTAAILVVMASTLHGGENATTDERIHAVENGLIEFTAPADMLNPARTDAAVTMPLAERMAHYKIPGVSIAIINDYKVEWAKGYGETWVGEGMPVTTETLFEAASTSKLVVSAITLHYVEKGLLDLDEDVNKKLESWKIPENDFTEKQKVTLRYLLTHQAGLNRPEGGFSWEDGRMPTLVQTLNGVAPAQNAPAAIEITPGTEWRYSNLGYLVIQQLLEDVTGRPFADIAREVVFEPLGMTSSTFKVPLAAEAKKKKARPHDPEGAAHDPEMHATAVANGGLITTPTDLAIFTNELILAYHGRSNRILSQKTVRSMFHSELELDPAVLGVPLGEGLGVLLFGTGDNFSFLHPGDNAPGTSSWLMGYPGAGNGIIVMANGAMGNLLAMEIVASVINAYGWPVD